MAGHMYWYALVAFLWFVGMAHAQTADEVAKLIERLVELDSIDVCKYGVKYRAGLEPPLAGVDCDESEMKMLINPYEAQGLGELCRRCAGLTRANDRAESPTWQSARSLHTLHCPRFRAGNASRRRTGNFLSAWDLR